MKRPDGPSSSYFEFFLVMTLVFGWFVYASVASMFGPEMSVDFSNESLLGLLYMELALLCVLVPVLIMRGWTAQSMGLKPSWRDTRLGVAGAGLVLLGSLALGTLFADFFQPEARATPYVEFGERLDLSVILLVSAVNGFFEELFVCGYLISFLRVRHGLHFAVNASVALRVIYHLYQGPAAIIHILPFGLAAAWWYAKTGRLWVLVVAHIVLDVVGLAALF